MVTTNRTSDREERGSGPDPFMRRFADIFIAICIPIVAASAGVIAYFQFDANVRMAAVFTLVVLVCLLLVHAESRRNRSRREFEERILVVARRMTEFNGDLEAVERRLAAVEDGAFRRNRDDFEQLVAEVEVIGSLTRQVIETVADLELGVADGRGPVARARVAAPAPTAAGASAPTRVDVAGSALVPDRFAHLGVEGFLELVRGAIAAERIDIHLQPIVTLPQRKIRFYEALTRLRTIDGETIHPSDYVPIAEARGLVSTLDEQILLKSVQILRRLTVRSKEVGVFLNLSGASLVHAEFFRDFVQVLEQNRDLCDVLVLEFPQSAVRAMGPIEYDGLRVLYDLGYRFSLDQVADLRVSFQNLADRGFRWVKISADRLLHRPEELGTDIHPADLADYFQRFGMELIADHVEREADVVDVLDFGVRLGQGFVFSPPRPVRIDVLQATPEPRSAPSAPPASGPAVSASPAARPRGPAPQEPPRQAAPSPRPAASPTPAPISAPRGPVPPVAVARVPRPAAEEPVREAARPGIRIIPASAQR